MCGTNSLCIFSIVSFVHYRDTIEEYYREYTIHTHTHTLYTHTHTHTYLYTIESYTHTHVYIYYREYTIERI
jgi:hypothetical protein